MTNLLPIFPLDVVLLPGAPLPLHIFEPRYKEMIGECLKQKTVFGVVRSQEEGVAEIGCTADILTVTKEYEDGRLDIVTQGATRFEVMEVNQERTFLRAEVLYLQDEPGSATKEQLSRLLELHNEILRLAGAVQEQASVAEEPQLSFRLAGALPLDLDFKQALLGMKSEVERVEALTSYFENIVPRLRRTLHVQQKAGATGTECRQFRVSSFRKVIRTADSKPETRNCSR
jgi:Lon protease-like protein